MADANAKPLKRCSVMDIGLNRVQFTGTEFGSHGHQVGAGPAPDI
jgi:hypothetical protein